MRWGLVQSLPLSPSYVDFGELSSPPVPLHRATALQNQLTTRQTTLAAAAKEASNSRSPFCGCDFSKFLHKIFLRSKKPLRCL